MLLLFLSALLLSFCSRTCLSPVTVFLAENLLYFGSKKGYILKTFFFQKANSQTKKFPSLLLSPRQERLRQSKQANSETKRFLVVRLRCALPLLRVGNPSFLLASFEREIFLVSSPIDLVAGDTGKRL